MQTNVLKMPRRTTNRSTSQIWDETRALPVMNRTPSEQARFEELTEELHAEYIPPRAKQEREAQLDASLAQQTPRAMAIDALKTLGVAIPLAWLAIYLAVMGAYKLAMWWPL